MDYKLATNDELENIVRFDSDCCPSLLKGVVEEMLNRNLFDRIIVDCFNKSIKNISWMKDVFKLDMEDFLQIGRFEIYKSVGVFQSEKGMSFTSFIFLRVQQAFSRLLEYLTVTKRDTSNNCSYNAEFEDGEEFSNLLPSETNVEKYVIDKLTLESLLARITERQKQIVLMKMEGYSFWEIGEVLGGVSHQAICKTYHVAIKNLRRGA